MDEIIRDEFELHAWARELYRRGWRREVRAILDGAALECGPLPPDILALRARCLGEGGEGVVQASAQPAPGAPPAGFPCPVCGLDMVEHERLHAKTWLLCPGCALLLARTDPAAARVLDQGEAGGARQPAHSLVHSREYTFCRRMLDATGARDVLNYGVGWSLVPEALRAEGVDAVGCDLWRPLIEQRRQELGQENFFHRDELPDRLFSLISAFEVFEHFINPLEDIALLADHLAEGGALFGSTDFWHGGSLAHHPSVDPTYWVHATHVTAWTWQSMAEAARRLGLGVRFFRGDCPEHSAKCFFVLHKGGVAGECVRAMPKVLPDVYGMRIPDALVEPGRS